MPTTTALSRLAVLDIRTALRGIAEGAASLEEVAERIVSHLFTNLRDARTDEPICGLVRLFKTHPYGHLPASVQAAAREAAGGQPLGNDTRCLTLLATRGDHAAWNSRHTSVNHQAIPLTSEEMILQSPMIARLTTQFGLDIHAIVSPASPLMLQPESATYNIFHVAQALGSPYVPAQEEFVQPFGIASVIGFGAPIMEGDLFAIILFSKVPLNAEAAEHFHGIALSAKLALLSAADKPVFAGVGAA